MSTPRVHQAVKKAPRMKPTPRMIKHAYYVNYAKSRGFRNRRATSYTLARRSVEKSWRIAYISRKLKKRQLRASWIMNVGAAVKEHGYSYGRFINGLRLSNIYLNRKMLGELALFEPVTFKCIVDQAMFARYQVDLNTPQVPVADRYAAFQYELEQLEAEEAALSKDIAARKQAEAESETERQAKLDEEMSKKHAKRMAAKASRSGESSPQPPAASV